MTARFTRNVPRSRTILFAAPPVSSRPSKIFIAANVSAGPRAPFKFARNDPAFCAARSFTRSCTISKSHALLHFFPFVFSKTYARRVNLWLS